MYKVTLPEGLNNDVLEACRDIVESHNKICEEYDHVEKIEYDKEYLDVTNPTDDCEPSIRILKLYIELTNIIMEEHRGTDK